jgi:hypothetical protein
MGWAIFIIIVIGLIVFVCYKCYERSEEQRYIERQRKKREVARKEREKLNIHIATADRIDKKLQQDINNIPK